MLVAGFFASGRTRVRDGRAYGTCGCAFVGKADRSRTRIRFGRYVVFLTRAELQGVAQFAFDEHGPDAAAAAARASCAVECGVCDRAGDTARTAECCDHVCAGTVPQHQEFAADPAFTIVPEKRSMAPTPIFK